jgi:dephospho-CoA kinase
MEGGISIVALSGFVHAGKTTAARWLEALGFCYCRPSTVLAGLLAERGEEVTREALQTLGSTIHTSGRQVWLISETVKRCESSQRIVVDGIRWREDKAYLSDRFGRSLLHVHIAASEETLIARHVSLGGDAKSYRVVAAHNVECGIPELASNADILLRNDGTMSEFRESVDRIVRRFVR